MEITIYLDSKLEARQVLRPTRAFDQYAAGVRKVVDTISNNWYAYQVDNNNLVRNKFFKR